MLRKLCLIIPFVVLVCLTSTAGAAVHHWVGGTNTDWTNPSNWQDGAIPVLNDDAMCDVATDPYLYLNSSGTLTGYPQNVCHFTSATNPNNELSLVSTGGNDGSLDPLGSATVRHGVLYMDSGTMTISSAFRGGKNGDGSGHNAVMVMSGGTINVTGINTTTGAWIGALHGEFSWAVGGMNATLTMTGGLITTGTFDCVPASTASGVINLNGGTILVRGPSIGYSPADPNGSITQSYMSGLFIGDTYLSVITAGTVQNTAYYDRKGGYPAIMHFSGGTLLAAGDVTRLITKYRDVCSTVDAYPNDTATKNTYVVFDYDDRNPAQTTVTGAETLKAQAWEPSPIDGSLFASINPVLTWHVGHSGSDCNDHYVYLGTSTASVAAANGSQPAGGQWSGTLYPAGLKNDTGTSQPNITATWTPIGPFPLATTLYWRVDEVYGASTTTGVIWAFRTAGKSRTTYPINGSPKVEMDPNQLLPLSWRASPTAGTHNVYLGTNSASLTSIASGLPQTQTTYIPWGGNQPQLATTYYWRVDEVNSLNSPATVTGDIASFTTTNYYVVDNFDSYGDVSHLQNPGGWSVTHGSGSFDISGGVQPHTGNGPASMVDKWSLGGFPNNTYTEFTMDYGVKTGLANDKTSGPTSWRDWSSDTGAKSLSVLMRAWGAQPALSQIYIYLYDGTHTSNKVYYPYPTTLSQSEIWTEWDIDLQQFNNNNLNLANITKLVIGYTNSTGLTLSYVELYVDDIRLYQSRCVSGTQIPAPANQGLANADLNNDCNDNLVDILYFVQNQTTLTQNWLMGDSNVPPNGYLAGPFDFNSAPGGPHNDGWVTGHTGKGVQLDGKKDYIEIDDLALPNFNNKTVMFWFKPQGTWPISVYLFATSEEYRANIRFSTYKGTSSIDPNKLVIDYTIGNSPTPTYYPTTPSSANWLATSTANVPANTLSVNGLGWQHIAMTLDNSQNEEAWLYINGVKLNSTATDGAGYHGLHTYNRLAGVCIGALNNGSTQFAQGVFDDFRIYNRVLTDSEVYAVYNSNTYPSDTPLIRYDFEENSGTTTAQLGYDSLVRYGHVYDPAGYNIFAPYATGGTNYLPSGSELWSKETPATGATSSRWINFKDYALIAKYYGQTIPNWP